MEALMNPSMSGAHLRNFRAVTDRLQALIPGSDRVQVEPEAVVQEPSVQARPVRAPLNQAWMPRIIARADATPEALPWWVTMVMLPGLAVATAMLAL